jgi:PAS domain S-box-containing protein
MFQDAIIEKKYTSILDKIPDGILILSKKNKVLYSNHSFLQLIGYEEINIHQLFNETNKKKFEQLQNLVEKNKMICADYFHIQTRNHNELLVELSLIETTFEKQKAKMIIVKNNSLNEQLSREILRAEIAEETNLILSKEIQKRNKTEQLLEEQFIRTKSIFESSHNTFLLTLNKKFIVTTINTHCTNYFFELTQKELETGADFFLYFKPYFPEIELNDFKERLKYTLKGNSYQIEIPLRLNDKLKWLEIFLNPIISTKNKVYEISLVAHDITEKKINEKKIVASLEEKEVLLKEIHHRVKNNLQVISSILNLQSMYVKDKNTLEILDESRNRIRSMAIIHEHLYQTTNFSSISFTDYIRNIVSHLLSSYSTDDKQIEFIDDLHMVQLSLDQAIPCGLILNELVSNSLKYAFSGKKKGTITVTLKEKANKIELRIEDDGSGFPEKFDIFKTNTLGLQLVNTLVDQLEGEIKYKSYHGIKYLITFDKIG